MKKKKNTLKPTSIFSSTTGKRTPQSLSGKNPSTIQKRKPSKPSAKLATRGSTTNTVGQSKDTSKGKKPNQDQENLSLAADMLKTSFLILQDAGLCEQVKIKGNEDYHVVVFPVSIWNKNLTLKTTK